MKRESKHVQGDGTRPVRKGPLDKAFPFKPMSEEPVNGGVLSNHEQPKDQELIVTEDFKKFQGDQQGRMTNHPRTLTTVEVSNFTTQGRTGFMGGTVFPQCGRIGPFFSFWLSLSNL